MANVLLDLSRLDAGHRTPPDKPTDIAPLLLALAQGFRVRMPRSRLDLYRPSAGNVAARADLASGFGGDREQPARQCD